MASPTKTWVLFMAGLIAILMALMVGAVKVSSAPPTSDIILTGGGKKTVSVSGDSFTWDGQTHPVSALPDTGAFVVTVNISQTALLLATENKQNTLFSVSSRSLVGASQLWLAVNPASLGTSAGINFNMLWFHTDVTVRLDYWPPAQNGFYSLSFTYDGSSTYTDDARKIYINGERQTIARESHHSWPLNINPYSIGLGTNLHRSAYVGSDAFVQGIQNVRIIKGTAELPTPENPSAVGDPHLSNLRGEKFDIHDGKHRLVHYPKGVPEEEALLMVDVQAVDMGRDSDCYSVYLQSAKLSGKWLGESINIRADSNSSAASSSASSFSMFFAGENMDWSTLSTHGDLRSKLNGTMPVTVTTDMRKAHGEDAMGGEEITFKIGEKHPVLVQVWSSHGKNQLTRDMEVRYLNVEVQNLPKNSGGIIGLDSYSRPATSRCDLIKEERDLMQYAENEAVNLLRLSSPQWTASATVQ